MFETWWRHRCDELMAHGTIVRLFRWTFWIKVNQGLRMTWFSLRPKSFYCARTMFSHSNRRHTFHFNRMIAFTHSAHATSIFSIFRKIDIYLVIIHFSHWICSMFTVHFILGFIFDSMSPQHYSFRFFVVGDYQNIRRQIFTIIVPISSFRRSSYCR